MEKIVANKIERYKKYEDKYGRESSALEGQEQSKEQV